MMKPYQAALMEHIWEINEKRPGIISREAAHAQPGQVAVMATARKMLKVIYWMLRNNEPFHPGPGVVDPVVGRREN